MDTEIRSQKLSPMEIQYKNAVDAQKTVRTYWEFRKETWNRG